MEREKEGYDLTIKYTQHVRTVRCIPLFDRNRTSLCRSAPSPSSHSPRCLGKIPQHLKGRKEKEERSGGKKWRKEVGERSGGKKWGKEQEQRSGGKKYGERSRRCCVSR